MKRKAKTSINDRPFQSIRQLAKEMNELAGKAVTEYSREADAIIISHCRDKSRIEHNLDGMLGFCSDDKMLKIYKKLCRYYYGINPSVTVWYVNAYRDMWDTQRSKSDFERNKKSWIKKALKF